MASVKLSKKTKAKIGNSKRYLRKLNSQVKWEHGFKLNLGV